MQIIMKLCLLLLSIPLWILALPTAFVAYLAYLCGRMAKLDDGDALDYVMWPALIIRWIIWRD